MEVIDTFAWIEYFAGTTRGEKARPFIEKGDAVTPALVIAEFADKYLREGLNPDERLKFMRVKSMVAPLDDEMAEAAGRISAERRAKVKGWGLADSCVLATARAKEAKVVTGDAHFTGLSDAILI
ncbi:MAG: type II toxin-antitoxin system VapC family toxin [Nitrososphaerota archaeon]|nr:type II toxin-antitoxin system VapC family toxin [Nitrososphaerota archaeon]